MTEVFVEQPLTSPGSNKAKCRAGKSPKVLTSEEKGGILIMVTNQPDLLPLYKLGFTIVSAPTPPTYAATLRFPSPQQPLPKSRLFDTGAGTTKGRHMLNKLDGVGPVDNRPCTDKLHHFVREKNYR